MQKMLTHRTNDSKSNYNPFSKKISIMLKESQKNHLTFAIDTEIKNNNTPSAEYIHKHLNKNFNYLNRLKFSKAIYSKENSKDLKNNKINPSLLPHKKGNYLSNSVNNFDFSEYFTKRTKCSLYAVKREKENYDNKYDQTKQESLKLHNKLKMKWATIKWLIDNRKESLHRLVTYNKKVLMSYNVMLKSSKIKGFSKIKFADLMVTSGISNDLDFINKLFWVFDDDQSGEIDFKEIVSGIEMFFESSTKLKIKSFFELCDTDHSGSINKNEFYNIMKKNIISSSERINLKRVIDKIFKTIGNSNGEVTLEEFYRGCETNEEIFEIIENNIKSLKSINLEIENDIKLGVLNFKNNSDQRMRKVFEIPEIFYPTIDQKFERLVDNFIESKNEAKYYQELYHDIRTKNRKADEEENLYS